jgi:hypothetical protein
MRNDSKWPEWLRSLRPDELMWRRMRLVILDEARPLLAARRESWLDAIADWATILSPVAAAVTLIFAGLALRHAGQVDLEENLATAPAVVELVRSQEAFPSTFGRDSVPDLDVMMMVLYEPAP